MRGGTGAQAEHHLKFNFFALPSTVAGTLGHTLCGAARNGGAMEGPRRGGTIATTEPITILCDQYSAPARRVTGATLAAPRSTSSLARIRSGVFDPAKRENRYFRAASAVVIVLPVTAAGTARGRDTPIKKQLVSPVRRDGRRHGQTHFVLSEQARDGRTAGL